MTKKNDAKKTEETTQEPVAEASTEETTAAPAAPEATDEQLLATLQSKRKASEMFKPLNIKTMLVPIHSRGEIPFISSAFGEAQKEQLLGFLNARTGGKAGKATAKPKKVGPKDPIAEAKATLYLDDNGHPAMLSNALRSAIINESHFCKASEEMIAGCIHVDCPDGALLPFTKMTMTDDVYWKRIVNKANGKTGISYCYKIANWACLIPIAYDADMFTADEVVAIIDRSGFHVAVGRERPQQGEYRVCTFADAGVKETP